jgi:hypothetical protein
MRPDNKRSDHDGNLLFMREFLMIPNCILPIAKVGGSDFESAVGLVPHLRREIIILPLVFQNPSLMVFLD